MPERHPGIGVGLLLAGLLLAAACWFDVGSAGATAWLAQVPMALGIAFLRGTRKRARLAADAGSLALLDAPISSQERLRDADALLSADQCAE